MTRVRSLAFMLFLLAPTSAPCTGDRAEASPRSPAVEIAPTSLCSRCDIVLVVLPGLRADAVDAKSMPRTWRWAQSKTVRFEQAISPSSEALPLLTGVPSWPRRLGQDDAIHSRPAAVSLPEVLRAAGYRTAAFATDESGQRQFGLDRGFDLYRNDAADIEALTARASEWIAGASKPWMLLIMPPAAKNAAWLTRADQALAALLERLPGAIAVITSTSDRGDSLRDETISVPLFFSWPTTKSLLVTQQAGTLGLASALAEMVGVQSPALSRQARGRGIIDALLWSYGGGDDVVVSQTRSARRASLDSLRSSDGWKLVIDRLHDRRHLYFLTEDPTESRDLASQRPDLADSYTHILDLRLAHR